MEHCGLCLDSSVLTASPAPSPSLFQVIRKVVRQIDPSGADDTQEHEEVISEGPLEDPHELEADIDYFVTPAKVPPGPGPSPGPCSAEGLVYNSAALCAARPGFRLHLLASWLPLEPPLQAVWFSLAISARLSV